MGWGGVGVVSFWMVARTKLSRVGVGWGGGGGGWGRGIKLMCIERVPEAKFPNTTVPVSENNRRVSEYQFPHTTVEFPNPTG